MRTDIGATDMNTPSSDALVHVTDALGILRCVQAQGYAARLVGM
jgi:hypothetical protein